jgi:hypothetical protein
VKKLAILGLFGLVMLTSMSCDPYHVSVSLTNNGRDPVHINGTRVAPGETKTIVVIESFESRNCSITRSDINLGTLNISYLLDEKLEENRTATIAMEEPVYFDLRFTTNSSDIAVSYTAP